MPLAAATISESAVTGAAFGARAEKATRLAVDVVGVTGGPKTRNDSDHPTFSGIAPATGSPDFRVANPGGTWGGFNLRLKAARFQSVRDGGR